MNHFHHDIFNFCDSSAVAGEHHAVTLEVQRAQGDSCSEKTHKLSGKHANESIFSKFLGKLWQLASLLKTYICIRYFPGTFHRNNMQNTFEHTVLTQVYSSQSQGSILIQWSLWMLPRLVFGKLIICLIFLKLQIKVVQSYLHPKAVNVRLFLFFILFFFFFLI